MHKLLQDSELLGAMVQSYKGPKALFRRGPEQVFANAAFEHMLERECRCIRGDDYCRECDRRDRPHAFDSLLECGILDQVFEGQSVFLELVFEDSGWSQYRVHLEPVVRPGQQQVEAVLIYGDDHSAEARQALEARRWKERYEYAVSGTSYGLWDVDLESRVAYFSDQFWRMLGESPTSTDGHFDDWLDRIHPFDREWVSMEMDSHLHNAQRGQFESIYRMSTASGAYNWIHTRGRAICDDEGRPIRLVGFNHDITAQKEREDRERRLIESLHRAQSMAQLGNWEYDLGSNRFWCSDQCRRMLARTGIQLHSMDDLVLSIAESTRAEARRLLEQARRNGICFQLRHGLAVEGDERIYDQRVEVMLDPRGAPSRIQGTIQDISDTERLRERISRQNQIFQTVLDSIDALVYVSDARTGEILFANQSVEQLFGSVGGKYCYDIMRGSCNRCLACPEENCPRRTAPYQGYVQHQQGNLVWEAYVEQRQSWMSYSERQLDWIDDRKVRLHAAFDITRRKEAEEELSQLNTQLEERVQREVAENLQKQQLLELQSRHAIMGEMLTMIAHQWRQPLSAISMAAGTIETWLEMGKISKNELRANIGDILGQTEYLSNTIEEFRTFFRRSKDRQRVDVRDVLRQSVELLRHLLNRHGVDLQLEVPDEPCMALTYAGELAQALVNIIKNAVDVLLERDIAAPSIDIQLRRHDANVQIQIRDNAGGIREETIERIFDPYYSTKSQNGTGLGLYMSRTIVNEHLGGILRASNLKNGSGAEFCICMPYEAPVEREGTVHCEAETP